MDKVLPSLIARGKRRRRASEQHLFFLLRTAVGASARRSDFEHTPAPGRRRRRRRRALTSAPATSAGRNCAGGMSSCCHPHSFSSFRIGNTHKYITGIPTNNTFSNMVVMKTPPSTTSSQKSARKVLKKYSVLTNSTTTPSVNGGGVTKDSSFYKLKRIVPTISAKENISKLDVVLEAINYIQRLQSDLIGDHEEEQVMDATTDLTDKESSRKCC